MDSLLVIIAVIGFIIKSVNDAKEAARQRERRKLTPTPIAKQPTRVNPPGATTTQAVTDPYQFSQSNAQSPQWGQRGPMAMQNAPLAGPPTSFQSDPGLGAQARNWRTPESLPTSTASASFAKERARSDAETSRQFAAQTTKYMENKGRNTSKENTQNTQDYNGVVTPRQLLNAVMLSQILAAPRCRGAKGFRGGSSNIG